MKKSLLLLAPALMLGTSLVTGGTFALFTSTASNSNNTFGSGSLQIALDEQDQGGDKPAYFTVSNMKPGDTEIQPVVISSTGSLQLQYTLSLALSGDLATGSTPLTMTAYSSEADATVGTNPIDLMQPRVLDAKGGPHDHETLYVKATLPLEANNDYQNKTATASISADAVQTGNNGGSGGNQGTPSNVSLYSSSNGASLTLQASGAYQLNGVSAETTYTIQGQLEDSGGNPVPGLVTISKVAGRGTASVNSNPDGSFVITYTSDSSGSDSFVLSVDGHQVRQLTTNSYTSGIWISPQISSVSPSNFSNAVTNGYFSGWDSGESGSATISFNYTQPQTFSEVLIGATAILPSHETYSLYGTLDGTTWVQIGQITEYVQSVPSPFVVPVTTGTYQGLRIFVSNSNFLSQIAISQIQLR